MKLWDKVRKSARGDGLKACMLRGGAWLGAGNALEQGLRFVRNMILTRVLLPEAFGTLAIVLSVSVAIDSLTQIGLKEGIIQNPRGGEDSRLNVAWWLSTGRCLALWAVGMLAAPWIAVFYHNPPLGGLLRVAMLSIVFTGAMSPRAYVALKQMRFHRWAYISHGGAILGVLFTLLLCRWWPNAWALVIGFSSESAARLLLSFLLEPYRPRLSLDPRALRELLAFSRGMFGLPLLAFLCMNLDIFVIGRMFSRAELGTYGMAVALAQAPSLFAMTMMGQLLMPAFSRVQADQQRFNRLLIRLSAGILAMALPLCVFACLSGRTLLTLVYGSVYSAAAVPFAFACLVAMANLLNGPLTTAFFARGMPQSHWRFALGRTVTLVLLVYPCLRWFGLAGAPLAGLAAIAVGYGLQLIRMRQVTSLDLTAYTLLCGLAAAPSLLVVAAWGSAQLLFRNLGLTAHVSAGVTGCIFAYLPVVWYQLRQRGGKLPSAPAVLAAVPQ